MLCVHSYLLAWDPFMMFPYQIPLNKTKTFEVCVHKFYTAIPVLARHF